SKIQSQGFTRRIAFIRLLAVYALFCAAVIPVITSVASVEIITMTTNDSIKVDPFLFFVTALSLPLYSKISKLDKNKNPIRVFVFRPSLVVLTSAL
ncbi:MAG: hypothetical protein ACJATX_000186, partial [Candidatus Paceibacteria bacterium]